MWRAVDEALRAGGVDLVFLDHIRAAEYGRLAKEARHRVPVALREHNVEHELNSRIAPEMARRWERLETRLRAHRYGEIETHLARYCDLVLPDLGGGRGEARGPQPGLPCVALPPRWTPATIARRRRRPRGRSSCSSAAWGTDRTATR